MKVSGTVYVLLDPDQSGPVQTSSDHSQPSPDQSPDTSRGEAAEALLEAKDETIGDLRDRVEHLQRELEGRNEELRRKDHLLAAALERIPAIEPPAEPSPETREPPETVSAETEGVEAPLAEEKPSFLRRIFGIPRDYRQP